MLNTVSIKAIVNTIIDPQIRNLVLKLNATYEKFKVKTFKFDKGITGTGVLLDTTTELQIPITVVPDEHVHDADQLPASVVATPNSLVKRDDHGYIYGSGSTYGNTGFKLADGNDVSQLFESASNADIVVNHTSTGSGNRLTNIWLEKYGNELRVVTTWGTDCNYDQYYQCQCCD